MIEITERPISPQKVIDKVKTDSSGCVVTYIGLIRNYSQGMAVLSVEYQDYEGNAGNKLQEIARQAEQRWQIDRIAITHRVGKLKVGEINLVVAVASPHRSEGFAACQYVIDQFKERLPTKKTETYQDGDVHVEG
jgi:molybdopterin synthase catalytic subunit